VSVFCVFFFVMMMSTIYSSILDVNFYYGAGAKSLSSMLVLLSIFLTIVAMGIVDVCHIYLHRVLCPSPTYVIQEQERGHWAKVYGQSAAENGCSTPSIGASNAATSEGQAFLNVTDLDPVPVVSGNAS